MRHIISKVGKVDAINFNRAAAIIDAVTAAITTTAAAAVAATAVAAAAATAPFVTRSTFKVKKRREGTKSIFIKAGRTSLSTKIAAGAKGEGPTFLRHLNIFVSPITPL